MVASAEILPVAVLMQRTAAPNRWEDWQFRLLDVVPDRIGAEGAAGPPRRQLLEDDGKQSRWLHSGFGVQLFADECKGYFLNLTSGQPSWFVSWRADEEDTSQVEVTAVSVSYIEADRRMFAQEHVESVPLPPELCEWLQAFTNQHFRPDSARKVRSAAFVAPQDRERLTGMQALKEPGDGA
ncbi:MAG: hypothetical protein RLZZ126_1726 [Pseudomonadota bacterium]|jgi:hypothetical protein